MDNRHAFRAETAVIVLNHAGKLRVLHRCLDQDFQAGKVLAETRGILQHADGEFYVQVAVIDRYDHVIEGGQLHGKVQPEALRACMLLTPGNIGIVAESRRTAQEFSLELLNFRVCNPVIVLHGRQVRPHERTEFMDKAQGLLAGGAKAYDEGVEPL